MTKLYTAGFYRDPGLRVCSLESRPSLALGVNVFFFSNGPVKTPVEAVKQTCSERRNYLKSAMHFYLQPVAGREICATLKFSVFTQLEVYHPHRVVKMSLV